MSTPTPTEAAEQSTMSDSTSRELDKKFMSAIQATHDYIEHRTHCASRPAPGMNTPPVCVTCAEKLRAAKAAREAYGKARLEFIG